ncbi:MAG: UDP-N-acetylmuramoyl-L-alanyl-D-glutamate--2,6-diaminopimelate ligase [Eubacterium sp.]|mgnify:FL=1|nr:UDP-N-acetylmuramoyl-L-alanyl-D-glutamate--2,6-diaminopimelate ligase [Eubacterium sp.]
MRLEQILTDIEYKILQGTLDKDVADIAYDSRKTVKGGMFVAIQGTVVDGHNFIESAVEAGAEVIVVEKETDVENKDITVLLVENGRKALSLMSAAYFDYPAKKMITVGITGTKGKSTTEHMVRDIIEKSGKICGIIGTVGAFMNGRSVPTEHTTPESYELQKLFAMMVEEGCEYMVMEVSSQGIKMDRVAGIEFDYGVFTNISPDHIGPGEHENFEEYLSCKAELFRRCKTGIINRDDEHYDDIVKHATCPIVTFGTSEEADMRACDIRHVSKGGELSMEFHAEGALEGEIVVGLPGRFNIYNALCAACTGVALGMPKEVILHALEHVKVQGRVEVMPVSEDFSVLIDFAHNGVSSESVLSTLREYNPHRIVSIFGCGGNRSKVRRYEMGEVIGRMSELAIITSDNPRRENVMDIIEDIKVGMAKSDGTYVVIPDREEAVAYALEHAEKGDMIILLGKGHEEYQEINGVKYHYSDREAIVKGMKKVYGKDFSFML